MHDLLKRNDLSHSGREIVMNSIMTVITYIIYEYEGCRHSKGRSRSLIHMGEGHFMLKIDHTQKQELEPGPPTTDDHTHCKRGREGRDGGSTTDS